MFFLPNNLHLVEKRNMKEEEKKGERWTAGERRQEKGSTTAVYSDADTQSTLFCQQLGTKKPQSLHLGPHRQNKDQHKEKERNKVQKFPGA